MNKKRKRIRMGERQYRVTRKPTTKKVQKELDGKVNYNNGFIFIHPALKRDELLETLIHEGLHASIPSLSEDAVDQAAKEITRLVRKFGFDQTE